MEDERTINDALAQRLRAEGYVVEQAFDGPSAVERAAAVRPDVVLLDVMLPGFDGLEVCRRVQAARPVPVLMLTARDDEADVLVGLGVGADDYLTKPFSMREVVLDHQNPACHAADSMWEPWRGPARLVNVLWRPRWGGWSPNGGFWERSQSLVG